VPVDATADEHSAVREQSCCTIGALRQHLSGWRELVRRGIVQLGGAPDIVATGPPAYNQHLSVAQKGGCVAGPSNQHSARSLKPAQLRIVDLSAAVRMRLSAATAKSSGDEHLSVRQQG